MIPADLDARLKSFRQQHVLRWWTELDEQARKRLAAQLERIDFDQIARLWQKAGADSDSTAELDDDRSRRARPPANVVRLPRTEADRSEWTIAANRGRELIAHSKTGVILVAGGEGTRLQFPHPKGMYPIGPVTQRTLFDYIAGQVAETSRRAGVRIPFYVMTSDATHDETVAFFARQRAFGLRPDDVRFFRQGAMPAVALSDGRLLMSSRGELASGPDGHGGLAAALARDCLVDDMRERGIEHLFYVQVDNPTAKVCDPAFLGFHERAGSEMSTKVVAKRTPAEKMGVLCEVDGRAEIIEYSDLPADIAQLTDAAGGLLHWAGNTAMHVFSRGLLERLVSGAAELPFHIAKKHVKHIDESGELVEPKPPAPPNACKFEKFIFDALPVAKRTLVVEADRAREFNPLKDLKGDNSPEAVQNALTALFTRWLRLIGIDVPAGTRVEISPRALLDESDLGSSTRPAIEARLNRTAAGWIVE